MSEIQPDYVDHRCPEISRNTLRGAFVAGAKWWEAQSTGGTMWASDRDKAWAEADERYLESAHSSGEAERLAADLEVIARRKGFGVEAEAAALLRKQADQIERERGEVRGASDEIAFQAKRAEQAEAALARVRVLVEQWQGRSKAAFDALDEDAGYAYAECGVELDAALRGAEEPRPIAKDSGG